MSLLDYNVMRWNSLEDGPWSDSLTRQFQDEGFNALSITVGSGRRPGNLKFIEALPGLECLHCRGRVPDDTAAFAVDSLIELELVTNCRLAVPDSVQPNMNSLVMTARPNLSLADHWPEAQRVRIGNWKTADLTALGGGSGVRSLTVEGCRQRATLEGADQLSALEELVVVNYQVRDTAPLRGLAHLREVRLLAAKPTPPHAVVDFGDLATDQLQKVWISHASSLRGLDLLCDLPALREVRLIGCVLTSEDVGAIDAARGRVKIEIL